MKGVNNTDRECLGLTIQLKKQGFKKNLILDHKDVLLGYYDFLEIRRIENWFDFSPRNYNVRERDVSKPHLVTTHYPIKLLFPKHESVNSSVIAHNYIKWNNPEDLLEKMPCASIALLNFTDEFKKLFPDQVSELEKIILSYYNEETLGKSNFGIFTTLGYSDLCILFADQSWAFALELIDKLRSKRINDYDNGSNEDVAILSTEYMIPLYHMSKSNSRRIQSAFKNSQLSVHLNLCPGCTSQMMRQVMPDGVKVYNTSGESDCMLLAENAKAAGDLFSQLMELSERKYSFTNFAIEISSSIQSEIIDSDAVDQDNFFFEKSHDMKDLVNSVEKFHSAVTSYENLLRSERQHIRIISLLNEFAAMVENVCSRPHAGKIREIVVPFLDSFAICLQQSCDEFSLETRVGSNELNIIRSSVECICRSLRSFLLDLSRADGLYMEREQYDHPSVSSSTELLLAFNRWIDAFSSKVQETTLKDNRSTYTFLVTSGGRDQTSTKNYFYFLSPQIIDNRIEEHIPLLIHMSEMSLFDFSGTILRAAHECMHFCGERFREMRAEKMKEFIALFFGNWLAWQLFGEHYKSDIIDQLSFLYCDKFTSKMKEEIDSYYTTTRDRLKREIASEIEKCLNLVIKKFNTELDFYARNVQSEFAIALVKLFSGTFRAEDTYKRCEFVKTLSVMRQGAISFLYQKCDEMLVLNNFNALFMAFNSAYQKIILESEYLEDDYNYIQMNLTAFLLSDEVYETNSILREQHDEAGQNDIFYDNSTENVFSVLESVNDIFKESFADVAACSMLSPSFEDYILMHIFEDWDIKHALYDCFANQYRIPAVLYQFFPDFISDNGQLNEKAHKHLSQAILRLNEHGMPKEHLDEKVSVAEIIQTLNFFLKEYNSQRDVAKILESYLSECKEKYERVSEQISSEQVEPIDFRKKFQEIRLADIDPHSENYREKINMMLDNLISTQ